MKTLIKKFYHRLRVDLELTQKGKWGSIWNYKHGFLQSTVDASGITKKNHHLFLSDRDYFLGHPYNGAYSSIIDNKLWLRFLLVDEMSIIPTYYFFKDEMGLLDLLNNKRVSNDLFYEVLGKEKQLVLKHTHSSGGKGFYLVELIDEKLYVNRKPRTKEQVSSLLNSLVYYVITEYVKQHKYSGVINSSSLNTIRFITFWNYSKKSFDIFSSFHRFGCNNSLVDNTGQGNSILGFIDYKKGVLRGDGILSLDGKYLYSDSVVHPNSKIELKDIQIPYYQEAKEKIIDICNKNSFLRYMGFDIAITDTGFKIIEINSRPGIAGAQQRIGFKSNSEIVKILLK